MIKQKLINILRHLLPIAIAFVTCIVLLRLYKILSIVFRTSNSPDVKYFEVFGTLNDLRAAFIYVFLISIPTLGITLISESAARGFRQISLLIILLLAFDIVHYYTITLIPLSADLYGYGYQDVVFTPKADLYANCADIVYWSGEPDQSLKLSEEGLAIDSENNDLISHKARILMLKGENKMALTLTREVLKRNPTHNIAMNFFKN